MADYTDEATREPENSRRKLPKLDAWPNQFPGYVNPRTPVIRNIRSHVPERRACRTTETITIEYMPKEILPLS